LVDLFESVSFVRFVDVQYGIDDDRAENHQYI